jgi:imidazolonepropionase-like amidohydrolase
MRDIIVLFVGFLVSTCVGGATAAPTAIVNVCLLDGRGGAPRPGTTVLIEGDRIRAVVPASQPLPPGTTRIDGAGRYLLPGFIDMHAHLLVPRGSTPRFDRKLSERCLGVMLDHGITTVRSPATPTLEGLALRDDLNAGRVRGPRARASMELINDPALKEAQLRRLVRDALPLRPDYVKAYARLTPGAVSTLINEAHAHGVEVIGHLGRTTWLEGISLGIDHLVHTVDWASGTLPEAARPEFSRRSKERGAMRSRIDWLEMVQVDGHHIRAQIRALAQKQIDVDLTLIAYDTKFTSPGVDRRYRNNPAMALVPELAADWRADGQEIVANWTASDYARWKRAWPKLQALVRAYANGGVRLVTGTDFTNPWIIPGEGLHQEFELLVEAGLSPSMVLRMTGENSSLALKDKHVGIVETGRRADLVLLRASPLADIRNTRSIEWVMQGGRLISRGPEPSPRVNILR